MGLSLEQMKVSQNQLIEGLWEGKLEQLSWPGQLPGVGQHVGDSSLFLQDHGDEAGEEERKQV
jgi:hypothetical protein